MLSSCVTRNCLNVIIGGWVRLSASPVALHNRYKCTKTKSNGRVSFTAAQTGILRHCSNLSSPLSPSRLSAHSLQVETVGNAINTIISQATNYKCRKLHGRSKPGSLIINDSKTPNSEMVDRINKQDGWMALNISLLSGLDQEKAVSVH